MRIEVPEWVKNSQVGDKVVVAGQSGDPAADNQASSKCKRFSVGTILTIRKIQVRPRSGTDWQIGWCFQEQHNEVLPMGHELDYHPLCFKPLTRKPTDISVFTDMLVGSKYSVAA